MNAASVSFSEWELRERFFNMYKNTAELALYLEVPVFSRSVDMVIQNLHDSSITAIEFKIHDWKRAILQVQSLALCFDYLSICLPKPKTEKGVQSIIQACRNNGVGLYYYDSSSQSFEIVLTSPRTSTVWDAQKKQIVNYLEAKADERESSHSTV